jgi:molybdate transport system substrate-binding protein
MMKGITATILLGLSLLMLSATPSVAGDINLSIAASLREAINDLSEGFARKNPGARILKNFGGSGALAKQIESGAPADIFISANLEWMAYLKDRNLIDSPSIGTFAFNTLVFAGNPAIKVEGMQDLVNLERIAIGSPKSVPAGVYASEAIRNAGMEKQLEKKLVIARDVRECLMYAERGEVGGAFVYRTDALQARQARILFVVSQKLYSRVAYPMGLTLIGARNREAAAFYRYLQSEDAKAILARYGFSLR